MSAHVIAHKKGEGVLNTIIERRKLQRDASNAFLDYVEALID